MTTFDLDGNTATYQIRAYKPGAIQINNAIFTHSLIITPKQIIENWHPRHISDLTADAFLPLLALKPNIILLGTGPQLIFPPIEVYGPIINSEIGIEIMNTSAACRTYQALTAENRNVLAALIL